MIAVENISIHAGRFSLENVSFTIPTGAWALFMGRTGAGKTTLLEIICGLRKATAGRVLLDGRDVTDVGPANRGIGYVPQDRALFQMMTVRENLAFALRVRKWTNEQIEQRVNELSDLLQVTTLLDRSPRNLSGGESQRVALGRALAARPALLCLDEPLSALDDVTREEIRAVLKSVRERTHVTTLHVTHHAEDGRDLANHAVVLRDGKVETGTYSGVTLGR